MKPGELRCVKERSGFYNGDSNENDGSQIGGILAAGEHVLILRDNNEQDFSMRVKVLCWRGVGFVYRWKVSK